VSRRLVASGYEVVGALFISWLIGLYFDDSTESTILSVLHGSLLRKFKITNVFHYAI
jgi:hypothetical protein